MAKKEYDWEGGAVLDDHTKKKHEILKEYFRQYLITRCQTPQQEKFRVSVVDGFSGGGLYRCGSFGSPLIFLDTLDKTTKEINIKRLASALKPIQVECLLIFNDQDGSVIHQLKSNASPVIAAIKEQNTSLNIQVEFYNECFEVVYPKIKQRLTVAKCNNVFFNLDQCGYSHVTAPIITDIMSSWKSSEVILTFMIKTLLTFLSPRSGNNKVPLDPGIKAKIDLLQSSNEGHLSKKEWLAAAEQIAYTHLKNHATYVSPFSINNPSGWRYWLMHFASNYRARQVYNNVLHESGKAQAHYGRSGLHMLSYDPREEGQLYLFDQDSRAEAKSCLYDDIPRFIAASGNVLTVQEFYASAYSETPAHSDDIHEMIMENPDLEVITGSGGTRRKAHSIKPTDILKLKNQRSFFFMFPRE